MELITTSIYTGAFHIIRPSWHTKYTRIVLSLINAAFLTVLSFSEKRAPIELNNYVTGFFIYDIALGHYYDKDNIGLLTGYIHHSVYLVLLYYIKWTDESHLIYLFLPFELPTLIQDLKKLAPSENLNNLFGLTFITNRVIYNIYILQRTPTHYKWIIVSMLTIHIFWLTQWLKKRYQNRG